MEPAPILLACALGHLLASGLELKKVKSVEIAPDNHRQSFSIDAGALGLLVTNIGSSGEQGNPASQILRLIMDNIPQRIFWKNRQSVYVWCNRNFAIDAGVDDPENITGKMDRDLVFTKEEAQSYYDTDQRVMANDRAEYQIYEQQTHVDGTTIWVVTNKVPLHDSNGNVVGVLGTYEDITERKQAEEALQRAHGELEKRVQERTAAEREQRTLAEALRDIAALLNSTLQLDEVLNRILSEIERVVPHDTANIILVEDGMAHVVRHRSRAGFATPPDGTQSRFQVGERPNLYAMFQSKQPLIIANTLENPAWVERPNTNWVRSYLGTPILIENDVIGFINLNSATQGFFQNIHADRLKGFANQAAIAIKNARSYERAQELAAIEERQRLARDLHDAVSQTLWTASLIADVLPTLWVQDHDESLRSLEKLQRLVRGALAEMRTLLLELRPNALVRAPLGDLILQLSQAVMSRKKLNIRVDVDGQISLDPEVQVGIYRLVQESLNNIVKHARATEVDIHVKMASGQLAITIQDNGRGFELTQGMAGGLGLGIMRERSAAIGVDLEIISEIGAGTMVCLDWPTQKATLKEAL